MPDRLYITLSLERGLLWPTIWVEREKNCKNLFIFLWHPAQFMLYLWVLIYKSRAPWCNTLEMMRDQREHRKTYATLGANPNTIWPSQKSEDKIRVPEKSSQSKLSSTNFRTFKTNVSYALSPSIIIIKKLLMKKG